MVKTDPDAPFTILSETRKKWVITIASLVTFVSPVSANIYYPALSSLSHDLHVTLENINLTITVFMVSPREDSLQIPIYGVRLN